MPEAASLLMRIVRTEWQVRVKATSETVRLSAWLFPDQELTVWLKNYSFHVNNFDGATAKLKHWAESWNGIPSKSSIMRRMHES